MGLLLSVLAFRSLCGEWGDASATAPPTSSSSVRSLLLRRFVLLQENRSRILTPIVPVEP